MSLSRAQERLQQRIKADSLCQGRTMCIGMLALQYAMSRDKAMLRRIVNWSNGSICVAL